ncbi:MAG: hypothetical protein JWO26_1293 [Rhodospirillales bacterium]|jgi:hypothetical protein|nr:hypothetical protein [Rhodospirillales bacterium]
MAVPNYAACNADPTVFKTWLATNMFHPGYIQNTTHGSDRAWIECQPAMSGMGVPLGVTDTADAACGAYKGVNMPGGANATALNCYVCNYVAQDHRSVTLGDQANFMVTTTMNGCTLGIGRAGGGGAVTVTHANTGGKIPEQRAQVFLGQGTQDVSLFEPTEYRNFAVGRSMNIFTFGCREAGTWKFYFQLFEKLAGNGQFRLWGVFPILQQQFNPDFARPPGV